MPLKYFIDKDNYRPQRSWGKVMFSRACVILFTGGHAWLPGGACVVARGCVVAGGGVCMVAGGHVWLLGGHVWLPRGCVQHRIQRLGRGAKKHEIYVASFGGHLFYDLFVQGWGGHGPLGTPPGSTTGMVVGGVHGGGACMVAGVGGMHGCWGGMRGCWGVCMVARGHAW